jgi:hypothetical protein
MPVRQRTGELAGIEITGEKRMKNDGALNARIVVDGKTDDENVHVEYDGKTKELLYLAVYALADITAEIIKMKDPTDPEGKKLISEIQEKIPQMVAWMLDENK